MMSAYRIKRCPVDTDYSSYQMLKLGAVVAQGWSESGDVSFFKEEQDLVPYVELICEEYGDTEHKMLAKLLRVFNVLAHPQAHDVFVATEGGTIKGICELPDRFTYAYLPGDEYANSIFPVRWVDWGEFCPSFGKMSNDLAAPLTNIGSETEVAKYINEHWDDYKREHNIEVQPSNYQVRLEELLSEFPKKCDESRKYYTELLMKKRSAMENKEYVDALLASKNLIFTGAPGTGKTFLAKEVARQITGDGDDVVIGSEGSHIGFCQFHPSYDYTDFVEGLRPKKGDGAESIGFERRDGIFKEFCAKAAINQTGNFNAAYDALRDRLESEDKTSPESTLTLKTPTDKPFNVYLNTEDSLSVVTSGCDKASLTLTRERLEDCYRGNPYTFHAGYFQGVVDYLRKEFGLVQSESDPNQKYVFIIDEINRGDISKIFGELFFAIDPGYRGPRKGRIPTQYQNLVDGGVFAESFYVPENVYVLGTMNDIDRSVESMDFAIRRRFAWREVTADDRFESMWASCGCGEFDKDLVWGKMAALNKAISKVEGLGAAFNIGPSYFARLADFKGLEAPRAFDALWRMHIGPLVREYLRGMADAEKAYEVLNNAYDMALPKSQQAEG